MNIIYQLWNLKLILRNHAIFASNNTFCKYIYCHTRMILKTCRSFIFEAVFHFSVLYFFMYLKTLGGPNQNVDSAIRALSTLF